MGDAANIDELIDRGIAAVDDDRLDAAEEILDDARGKAGENHVRVLHLAGLHAWASGDIERATGYLMQATDLAPDRADIYLDCAECLFNVEEVEEAEAHVRAALRLAEVQPGQADEARLLLAQVRLADDDPDEALEVLGSIDDKLKDHPAFLSTYGAALLGADRVDESIVSLKRATEQHDDDADLHYQLGIAYDVAGQTEASRDQMVLVLKLDLEANEAPETPPAFAEVQELRSNLEDVLDQLPDPLLKLVASAPITVQGHASEAQVREGVNPRSMVCFTGTPKRNPGDEAELTGIIVMRDLVLEEVSDEAEVERELFHALYEELQFFFKRDDLVVAEG